MYQQSWKTGDWAELTYVGDHRQMTSVIKDEHQHSPSHTLQTKQQCLTSVKAVKLSVASFRFLGIINVLYFKAFINFNGN